VHHVGSFVWLKFSSTYSSRLLPKSKPFKILTYLLVCVIVKVVLWTWCTDSNISEKCLRIDEGTESNRKLKNIVFCGGPYWARYH